MTSYYRMTRAARRTRKTLYVVAGLYVAIGLFVAAGAALAGDRLSAFIGLLIVSGALAVAVLLSAVLRITNRIALLAESLNEVRTSLEQMEKNGVLTETRNAAASAENTLRTLDLIGSGDPSLLTAATLDRSVFPRIAKNSNEPAPAPTSATPSGNLPENARAQDASNTEDAAPTPAAAPTPDLAPTPDAAVPRVVVPTDRPETRQTEEHSDNGATRADRAATAPGADHPPDPHRLWKKALRNDDLPTCRTLLPTLSTGADPETIAALTSEMEELADRIEDSLRTAFADCVRQKDYAAALATGQKIATLLPDRPIATEFAHLKPHLDLRIEGAAENTPPADGYSKAEGQ